MTLYTEFKSKMPTNEELCVIMADLILQNMTAKHIKSNFSEILYRMHDEVYRSYLENEKNIGNEIILTYFPEIKNDPFNALNEFYMSIFQSRKSRAGKAFEYIIRTLFKRLNYSFSEQVNIDGAKPDFVLPSEEFFKNRPMDSVIFTAKRTLRERWRQVVTEANKGYAFFLATIDTGVSMNQIQNMAEHKVYMVVPKKLIIENEVYSSAYNVISFEDFFLKHLDPAIERWS